MPAYHHIDNINKLIITEWKGGADIEKFISAYQKYQRKVRNAPEVVGYDEVVDFTNIKNLKYSFSDLKTLAKLISSFDESEGTKAAYIINSKSLFILLKSYIVLRRFLPYSKKQVKIFYDYVDALKWIHKDEKY